ncbi:MAG: glycosyl hydrolase, partial [Acidobacteriota bacterium]
NQLPVFGKIQSPDAIAKNQSTALYGNASTISESPKKQGLIYVGTDDGLIQVTENDGGDYRKIEKFPGIPDMSYVSRVLASQHDQNTVYALFNNHQNGDFKPYILKSTDTGKTWTSIVGDLPVRGSLYAIVEDYVNPNLLFVGTEFGVFFTVDGGQKWIQMKGNLPTIAVRDIAIQKQANDLVLATFGRGFYVLDDYSMMRQTTKQSLEQSSMLFPVKDALMYIRSNAVFSGFQGSSFYTAPNPPYGAAMAYYLKDAPKTLKQKRQEAEREADKKKQPIRYPSIEELRAETEEDAPALLFTITDEQGKVVRRLTAPAAQGIQRVVWDMRYTPPAISAAPPRGADDPDLPDFLRNRGPQGPLVMPGKYSVEMAMRVGGVVTPMPGNQNFNIIVEGREKMTDAERAELVAFQRQLSELQRSVGGANEVATATKTRIGFLKRAASEAPVANQQLINQAKQYDDQINNIINELRGGRENTDTPPPSISSRVSIVADTIRLSTVKPTQTQIDQFNLSSAEFKPVLARLRKLVEVDLPAFEKQLEAAGAPLTPGRLPQ